MEILLVTKKQIIGLDEDDTGLSDLDYFSALPNYYNSIGVISEKSMKMLSKNRQKEIANNTLGRVRVKSKKLAFTRKYGYYAYSIKDIKPVYFEVFGYNCIINLKKSDYSVVKLLKPFLFGNTKFTKKDFKNLEDYTDYLISSYYDGEASFLYTKNSLVPKIIEVFNTICIKNGGGKITIENLSNGCSG